MTDGLRGTLLQLIEIVERSKDQRFHRRPLAHGLLVEIGLGDEFNLRISRAYPAAPSATEWRTIIDYLPEKYQPAKQILPRDFGHGGRSYLEAHWPIKKIPTQETICTP